MLKKNLTISICGKGGVGKTSFTALLLKYLIQSNYKNILVVDADPAVNLGDVLGIGNKIKHTIGAIVDKTLNEVETKSDDYDAPALLEYKVWESLAKNEDLGFDLLSMGKTSGNKCYCTVNNVLVVMLDYLKSFYNIILVDMEAGLEHLSRGTDKNMDILFIIVDPSHMAIKTTKRIADILKECRIKFREVFVIGNRFSNQSDDIIRNLCNKVDFTYVGLIPYDIKVFNYNLQGKSLINLPNNSIAFLSVVNIIQALKIL